MESKIPSQTKPVAQDSPSPDFPRKSAYEDIKASTINSELKKQHTTTRDKVKKPGSTERIQPGPGLVRMASIQIGELGQDAKSGQQPMHGPLVDEQMQHQFQSARQGSRSSNFYDKVPGRASSHQQEGLGAGQLPPNPMLHNNPYQGQLPYNPLIYQQLLMQHQQLLLSMHGQVGGVSGVPGQGVGAMPPLG